MVTKVIELIERPAVERLILATTLIDSVRRETDIDLLIIELGKCANTISLCTQVLERVK